MGARFAVALLLAVMLPLRGFASVLLCAADAAAGPTSVLAASMPGSEFGRVSDVRHDPDCAARNMPPVMHDEMPGMHQDMSAVSLTSPDMIHHAEPLDARTHGHSPHTHAGPCGECCCTAAVCLTARWEAPRLTPLEVEAIRLPIPLTVTLDGLERPPRR